jgi:hypothetical protein
MSAGASAQYEAQRSLLEAAEYERLAAESRARAGRYQIASRAEQDVFARLSALSELGWRVLPDRRWAGSKRANVDVLLVGAGGVVVADVKAWRDLHLRHGSIFGGDECRDDEAAKLRSLTDRVQESLSDLGVTRQVLHPVLVFSGQKLTERAQQVHLVGEMNVASWVTRLGHRLTSEEAERVAAVLERDFPPYDLTSARKVRPRRLHAVMPRPKATVPQADALFDIQELTDSLMEAALSEPIEHWMTFLHPDQNKLVSSSWNGPARIRGPVGTGKTVVALHRAAYLAERRSDPVLYVTFVKTLPIVLASLCERMSPTARANIEFTGLHRLAVRLLNDAEVRVNIDGRRVNSAFAAAWASVGRRSVLSKLDERWTYWKEELDHVIKGRGLTDFQEYADLVRLGRGTPMRAEHREAMWELYVDYERRLNQVGIHDFSDALIMARDVVRDDADLARYSAVVVDEVQDLNLVGLQLLHALSGDGPDRLLMVGDGQQAVYPGGFTLSEAGITVTGRAHVLRTNYRNTREVLEVASRMVSSDPFTDLDGELVPPQRELEIRRKGGAALTVRARDQRSLETALTRQILNTRDQLRVPLGDIAVLCLSLAQLEHWQRVLRNAGIPVVDLLEYDGVTTDRVKIGTFKRAKGLEFKYVLLPDLREGPVWRYDGESDEAYRERAERMRRELYVGMTRARDGLWLGYLDHPRR